MQQFIDDVDKGLSQKNKFLKSKYFYDQRGNELFIKIMHLPEYYLYNAELEIFSTRTADIVKSLDIEKDSYFELIEPGAGDGTKTKELLKWLLNENYRFHYLPVDISSHALADLETVLKKEIPALEISSKVGDYFEVLKSLKTRKNKKIILFLGSNLGNLKDESAVEFITALSDNLHANDKLLLGVDLIKDKEIVLPAYNDSRGVTAEFNLNLLTRINRELGGNFNPATFRHAVEYTREEGIVKTFLESTTDQTVFIEKTGKEYHFSAGEKISTEISRKYNDSIIANITGKSRFKIIGKLTDTRGYFADYVFNVE